MKVKQPWIHSSFIEFIFILLPPFGALAIIFLFPDIFSEENEVKTLSWFILILLIDVAHVYSTLYRSYLDKNLIRKHKILFYNTPLLVALTGMVIYGINPMLFWRLMAYLAVFHFIRQQYGFMRIYSRKEEFSSSYQRFDTLTIYTATIYPILFWHLTPDRNFEWFIKGDFIQYTNDYLLQFFKILYFCIIIIYMLKELRIYLSTGYFNFPKNLLISGTICSWYFGIIYFNGDLPFTMLNVVSHGIPYMALIWIYGRKQNANNQFNGFINRLIFTKKGLVFFLLIISILAFIEEALWDRLIWNSHPELFGFLGINLKLSSNQLLTFIDPLLAVPQITHYIIDGYIWKIKKDNILTHKTN